MKLYDLLRTITHEHYNVILRDINMMNQERELYNYKLQQDKKGELLKAYLDYIVLSIDENWNIVVVGNKI